MPTYEYHCDSCDKNFDVVQSFHDDPLTECPTCGSPVKKVFGSVGIVFKGSGFYKTDSRSSGSSKAVAGDGSAPAKSDTSESSSSGSGSDGGTSSGDASSTPASTPTPAASTAPKGGDKGSTAKSEKSTS